MLLVLVLVAWISCAFCWHMTRLQPATSHDQLVLSLSVLNDTALAEKMYYFHICGKILTTNIGLHFSLGSVDLTTDISEFYLYSVCAILGSFPGSDILSWASDCPPVGFFKAWYYRTIRYNFPHDMMFETLQVHWNYIHIYWIYVSVWGGDNPLISFRRSQQHANADFG